MTYHSNSISHVAASYITLTMIIIRQIKRGDRSHNESQSGKFNSGLRRRLTRLRIGTTMEDEEKKEEERRKILFSNIADVISGERGSEG